MGKSSAELQVKIPFQFAWFRMIDHADLHTSTADDVQELTEGKTRSSDDAERFGSHWIVSYARAKILIFSMYTKLFKATEF